MNLNTVYLGDALETVKTFPDKSIDCVVTSPPYYALRDYGTGEWVGGDPNCPHYRTSKASDLTITGHKRMQEFGSPVGDAIYKSVCPLCGAVRVDKQIGLEETPEAYIQRLVDLFHEIKRALKDDGTLWINIGDSYYGGGWRNASFNEHSGDIQKGSVGTHCGETMPNLKGGYNDIKDKDLIGIPWMLAFALRADGWYLRQDIIWHKPNPMPESVTDRCTKSHEYIFLLSKSKQYYFDYEAIMEECSEQQRMNYQSGSRSFGINKDRNDNDLGERSKNWMPKMRYGSGTKTERTHEQGYSGAGGHRDNSGGFDSEIKMKDGVFVRNKRDVWTVNVKPNKEAHFATYPQALISPCILAGCKAGGVVLDPFMGSGTTGIVARKLNRNFVGCELNPDYKKMAERRIFNEGENLFNTI